MINSPEVFGVKINLFRLIILLIIIPGLILSVFLVTHPQIFKSKATVNLSEAFEITDEKGNPIHCDENVCLTKSLNLNIKIIDPSLLKEENSTN